jgi:2-dehydropantoate 2-reductase
MNVLVYGGGAVGLGISSCLIESGARVSIVAREKTAKVLSSGGFQRTGIFGNRRHDSEAFSAAPRLDPYLESSFDYVIVCTKSFDTKAAAVDLTRLHAAFAPCFVLFQNGWGNREIFCRYLPSDFVYNARVITGFSRPGPAKVDITAHAEDIHIGNFAGGGMEETAPLCTAISSGGVPCSFTPAIVEDLWAKMLYNCSLNSLGALFEASYGELADNPSSRELIDLIIDECFSVMTAAGFKTHWQTAAAYREVFYGSLIPVTRNHYPSTLQDIRAGKKTEIDALNGSIVRLAAEVGVEAPYNRMAYSMVKFKEGK